ncbi:SRPBCC domain-containing protein [Mycolicibacterium sp. CR10]|uniref:SRPBCC family protein n=1 Tax=Mycolicibacterium sp. CR10 TaxID=2562314 RepID=UPI001485346F|nr:SRPBCC domain-containing protein [Mycolicibacterium sp. CR10]
MPLKKDDDGRRWVELEFLVPGTPEQVWQAIATGPGMSAWFTPTTVDERVGGAVEFDFGEGTGTSRGVVTEWQPPVRFGYEEHDWSGEAPPVATEVVVTSRSGDRCVVRMVHSLFTDRDDWDDELEGFETGWPGFFAVLRLYLAHFPGQPAANVRVMTVHSAGTDQAWSTLAYALGVAGVDVGTVCEARPGPPRLRGVLERVHQDAQSREVLLRLTDPVPGVAAIGSFTMGDQARVMVSIYFYGAAAGDTAAAELPKWQAWMAQLEDADSAAS